jgi:predicted ATPase
VGPNASGKSTFLDVVGLMGDLLDQRRDVTEVLRDRSSSLAELTFMQRSQRFEIAVEAEGGGVSLDSDPVPYRTRYEVALGVDDQGVIGVLAENLWLKRNGTTVAPPTQSTFPMLRKPRDTIVLPERRQAPPGWRKVVSKASSGNDYFRSEVTNWNAPFRFGPQRLALANLPEDEERFPRAVWFRRLMQKGVQRLALSGEAMRRPSPPGSPQEFQPDGSNLPWAIDQLLKTDVTRLNRWLDHVRTALPDIQSIETIERPEDKHRYLVVRYQTGLRAPSWTVSDGTLRLLALTLVAYLDASDRVYLIEEPENGIHPQAVEAVFRSLSGTYDAQILCATHSPVLLAQAEPESVLCFARTAEGATDVIRGSQHPNLRDWKRSVDLGTLFATGVLG